MSLSRSLRSTWGVLVSVVRWPRIPRPRRRLIPIAIGIGVFVVAFVPYQTGIMSDDTANRWTIILACFGFSFKGAEYVAMRRRMTGRGQKLSVFGLALIDWFTALALFALTMAAVFGITYYYALGCDPLRPQTCAPPFIVRTLNRAAIDGAVAFAVATGAAAWWEMRRAGEHLAVHTDEWDEKSERRSNQDRRKANR